MYLLEDLKVSLLNFNFVMIYIFHKILELLKNHLNYVKDNIFECFFKKYNRLIFIFLIFFFITFNDGNPRPEVENIIKDIRNLFRLKKDYITLQLTHGKFN